jgi:low temperature requirement protein LtrA
MDICAIALVSAVNASLPSFVIPANTRQFPQIKVEQFNSRYIYSAIRARLQNVQFENNVIAQVCSNYHRRTRAMSKPRAIRPVKPRNTDELHRAATPLELLFDLVSVIAIAAAAAGLHHGITEAHYLEIVVTFIMAFFTIWWAWMNYTWYASAYDNDDVIFRILTLVIMGGSLLMAAGINRFFVSFDLALPVIGYIIMRIGLACLWARAAIHDLEHRKSAITYMAGILLAQLYWIGIYFIQPVSVPVFFGLFMLGVILELSVPAIAERQSSTPWQRHHIIERYGLLNIIVLGETLLATTIALQKMVSSSLDTTFVVIALSSLVIVFSMWWLYFSKEGHLDGKSLFRTMAWGYGHYLIFASGAAIGAGFAVLVDIESQQAKASLLVGHYAVAVPVAIYMLGLWFVRDQFNLQGAGKAVLPVFATLVLLAPLSPVGLEAITLVTVLSVVVRSHYVNPKTTSNI